MPLTNNLTNYSAIADNTKIQFKSGTQAALNTMIANGTATEGTFYLTIDTHKLYVGRKKTSDNKVYPEQVSRGVTVVGTSADLPSFPSGSNPAAPADAIEEGELFYVTDKNILAALKYNAAQSRYEWVQINPPTGIEAVRATVSTVQNSPTDVNLNFAVETQGGSKDATLKLIAGSNITLTPSQSSDAITIESQNSQSNLGITEATDTTNKAPIVLSDGTNLDTSVSLVGAQDTTTKASYVYNASTDTSVVDGKTYYTRSGTNPNYTYTAVTSPSGNPSTSNYYERQNVITITGPGVQGISAASRGTAGATTGNHGFELVAKVKNGGTSTINEKTLANNESVFDPIIDYGENSSAYFYGGRAKLDVYTTTEADAAIEEAISRQLQVADAMVYRGTVDTSDKLTSTSATGSVRAGAHKGDTYKAVSNLTFTQIINGVESSFTAKSGDLLIANGQEYTQSTDSSASGYTSDPSLIGTLNPSTMYWDIIPSGDEPVPQGRVVAAGTSGTPYFTIEDANLNSNNTILKVSIDNANSVLVKAVGVGSSATDYKLQLQHDAISRSDSISDSNLTSNPGTDDSVGASGIKMFALTDTVANSKTGGITTDGYGHITGVTGRVITLKHNYVSTLTATHTASNATSNGIKTYTGSIGIGANNSITGLNTTSASAVIKSTTLAIDANQANTELSVDLVWGTF